MDLVFTEEHDELRSTLRAFLAEKSNEQAVRTLMSGEVGFDRDVWSQMAEQMGLAGLIIPEEYGGAGFGWVELCVVLDEMGRALYCGPYLSTAVLAASTILHVADAETREKLLPGIASGETIATLAYVEENGRWDPAGIEMAARAKENGYLLDGVKSYVIDGHSADLLLVAARCDGELAIFAVEPDASGLTRTLLPSLDLTRKLARIELNATPARRISTGDATGALEQVLALTTAALAAEQVGGAQKCLEMSTEYARTRIQFGRPIGSYQAIKHKCADMLVAVEFAKSAAYDACFSAAAGQDIRAAAALAKSYCSETYFRAAADTIQIHGGMGFTWEHNAHLYFKRAKSCELLFGDPVHHREILADALGL